MLPSLSQCGNFCLAFQEFILSEDYNKMSPARTYQGETGSVCTVCVGVSYCHMTKKNPTDLAQKRLNVSAIIL